MRAQVASLKRCVRNGERRPDDPKLAQAEQKLRAIIMRERAERFAAELQTLPAEQRQIIAAILLAKSGA
ncbi:hypothetical protein A5641_12190 [Mycobacterium sp. 1554424.7]|nr:hypothetical protein A5641_12190 [Mycobacterium sp. 1554424.7]